MNDIDIYRSLHLLLLTSTEILRHDNKKFVDQYREIEITNISTKYQHLPTSINIY